MKMINVLMLMLAMSLQSPAIFAATADVDSEKEYDSDDFDSDDFDSDSDDDLSLAAMHRRLRAKVAASAQASTDAVATEAGAFYDHPLAVKAGAFEERATPAPEALATRAMQESGLDFTDPAVVAALQRQWAEHIRCHESLQIGAAWAGAGAGVGSRGGVEGSRFVMAAPVSVTEQAYFSVDELSTVSGFANALFATKAETNFYEACSSDNADRIKMYFRERLTLSSAYKRLFNRKRIAARDLMDGFSIYRTKIKEERDGFESWRNGEKTNFFTCAYNDTTGIDNSFHASMGSAPERSDAYVEKRVIRRAGEPDKIVLFMGDIHGSVHALLRNLLGMVQLGYLREDFTLAEHVHLVFLGDFVDRGLQGIESLFLILRLKNATWDQVHIARGNHESGLVCKDYGLLSELQAKYPQEEGHCSKLWSLYAQFCSSLPSAIFLGVSDGVDAAGVDRIKFMQACHGALVPSHDPKPFFAEPDSVCYEKIQYLGVGRGYEWHDTCCSADAERLRGIDLDTTPLESIRWKASGRDRGGDRAVVFQFHRDDITRMLHKKDLFMLMRGHQDINAPCKVLRDDEKEPISWREHPAFIGITPGDFFARGINLSQAPNCITLSTATEGRGLDHEGFLAIRFGDSLASSSLWVYEINLEEEPSDGCYVFYKPLIVPPGAAVAAQWPIEPDGSMKRPFDWMTIPPREPFVLSAKPLGPYVPQLERLPFDFLKARVQDAITLQTQEVMDAINWSADGAGASADGDVGAGSK